MNRYLYTGTKFYPMVVIDEDSDQIVCVVADQPGGDRLAAQLDGYSPVITSSLEDTLAALEGGEVTCVVSSYDIEGDSGRRLLRQIRLSWPQIPIVLYGESDPRPVLDGMTVAGAFVHQDASPERLRESIESVIDSKTPEQGKNRSGTLEFESGDVPSEVLLEAIFDSIPVHTYVKDEFARHVLVSKPFITDPSELLGRRDVDVDQYPEELSKESYADDLAVIREQRPIIDKEEHFPGTDQWHLTSKVPLYADGFGCIGLLGVTREITQRKRQEREIRRQNERLDRFAQIVSHDLRNPLSIATGRLELLQNELPDSTDHLEDLEWALERMDAIVDDVLALTRQGQTVLEDDAVSLEETIIDARRSVDEPALTVDHEDDLEPVIADRSRLQRLFENLFDNAIEHAGPDPTVTVETLERGSGFAVSDDGPGIPSDRHETVFEPGETDSADGTGFGLAIVKEIVDAHDWSITVSESETSGARFEITNVQLVEDAKKVDEVPRTEE